MFDNIPLQIPSPIEKLDLSAFDVQREVWIKRDDLIHPEISGNKWRKLKYNIEKYFRSECTSILTFGGAFSNHLYATAAACDRLNIPCIGIVRGSDVDLDNPTMEFCRNKNMKLVPVSRSEYFEKERSNKTYQLILENHSLVIPEGGNNVDGVMGTKELFNELYTQLDAINTSKGYQIACPVGTGTTISGVFKSELSNQQVFGFMAAKDVALEKRLANNGIHLLKSKNWSRFGSYDHTLIEFIQHLYNKTSVYFDPIYGAKMMHTLIHSDLLKKHKNEPFVIIHTGGLQGILGVNYRQQKKGKKLINYTSIH